MEPPRYKSSSHYRTRRSCREWVALCASDDLGATALDRPIVEVPSPPPVPAARCRARGRVARRSLLSPALLMLGLCVAAGAVLGALLGLLAR